MIIDPDNKFRVQKPQLANLFPTIAVRFRPEEIISPTITFSLTERHKLRNFKITSDTRQDSTKKKKRKKRLMSRVRDTNESLYIVSYGWTWLRPGPLSFLITKEMKRRLMSTCCNRYLEYRARRLRVYTCLSRGRINCRYYFPRNREIRFVEGCCAIFLYTRKPGIV